MDAARADDGGAATSLLPEHMLAAVAAGEARLRLSYHNGPELVIMAASDLAALEAQVASAVPGRTGAASPLSGREAEILRLIGSGMTGQQVATELGLALNTVNQHLIGARRKLGVARSKDAAARAAAAGWLREQAS